MSSIFGSMDVMGDFNEILYQAEKVGGRQRNKVLMSNFRQTMEVCKLKNLGQIGENFTWSNKHGNSSFTKERLDRAIANQAWMRVYNAVIVETLVARSSDHKPLGLNEGWIKLIMFCVSRVSYSVLINGRPGSNFLPSRELRQGDPLSLYLFLFCAEGLSSLINNAEERGEINGLTVKKGGTSVSHLFFGDDSIMFCKVTKEDWGKVQEALKIYE